MKPERWKQIDQLFSAALEIDSKDRAQFLERECLGDEALRQEIESLLASDEQERGSIQEAPAQLAVDLLKEHSRGFVPGRSIGPYKTLSLIGSGGMGEVYRASDPRIGREVAIKVLPVQFSQDPDRLRRFEQEARAAGVLNHPNIVAIYDAGAENGSPYLVSELLKGELLRQKLQGNPIPIRKAIDYSLQIAKGLSAAHEKGIVHRDLKPENIFVTKEGIVKILDFGLAKLTQPEASKTASSDQESASNQTESGVVVGTVVYMSPEQVRGTKVDHRSDIFAFGSVLYEMLSGKRPFQGESQIEVMHAILKEEPADPIGMNPNIPPALERIVRRCLEKNPDHRFQSTSDLAFHLESVSLSSGSSPTLRKDNRPIPLGWLLSGLFLVSTLVLGFLLFRSSEKIPLQRPLDVRRLSILVPEDTAADSIAMSPDGRRVVFSTSSQTGSKSLWLRSLDSSESEEIPGTEDAIYPFWSPDSRSIGFFTQHELKKVTIGGGPPESLSEANYPRGGTWNREGVILFAPDFMGGLFRISAEGGEATPVTEVDYSLGEDTHRYPQFLPDGKHFSYWIRSTQSDHKGIFVGSLDSKEKKRILPDLQTIEFSILGFGVFIRNFKLMAQPFDFNRLEFTGVSIPIADNVTPDDSRGSRGLFSVSQSDALVYGNEISWENQPSWFDRSGKPTATVSQQGWYALNDLSLDENRLLTYFNGRLWMVDLLKGTFLRFSLTNDSPTIFSPDGSRVAYKLETDTGNDLYQRPSSGTGKAELLLHSENLIDEYSWSMDGRFILYTVRDPKTKFHQWVLPLFGERKPLPLELGPGEWELQGRFSPNGKWIAYVSEDGDRTPQVYVRSFPVEAGGRWEISTDGGDQPKWGRDGKELYYLTVDKKLMAVEVETGTTFKTGTSRMLFQTKAIIEIAHPRGADQQYFVAKDGQRFLINTRLENSAPQEITVLLNWKSLLKK